MAAVRIRGMVAACLVASLVTSGCTSRAGGELLGHVLVGVLSVVANAAVRGGLSGSRGGDEARPRLTECEQKLADWREVHQGIGEMPPARLRCTPEGDFPELVEEWGGAAVEELPEEPPQRTVVPTGGCGGTETERQRCEEERARGEGAEGGR